MFFFYFFTLRSYPVPAGRLDIQKYPSCLLAGRTMSDLLRMAVLCLFLCMGSITILAQQTWHLQFAADSVFFNSTVVKELNGRFVTSPEEVDLIVTQLKSDFYENGFISFSVDSIKFEKDICRVFVYTGKPYRINQVVVKEFNDNGANERWIQYDNEIFSPEKLRILQLSLLKELEQNAYPNPTLVLEAMHVDSNAATLFFNITPGKSAGFDTLINEGNLVLRYQIYLDLLGLKRGKQINISEIQSRLKILNASDFAIADEKIRLTFENGVANVRVKVDKKTANTFDGILGFVSDPQKTSRVNLTGNVNIFIKNAFVNAESFQFEWIKSDLKSQHLISAFKFPFIPKLPAGVEYTFDFYKKDSTYIKIQNNPGVIFMKMFPHTFKIFTEFDNVNYIHVPEFVQGMKFSSFDYSSWTIGYNVHLLWLDNLYNTKNGFYLEMSMASGMKTIHKNLAVNTSAYDSIELKNSKSNISLNLGIYKQFFHYPVLKLDVQSAMISGKNLNTAELYRLGGIKSMRGFDEESILASRYIIFNCETRFPIDKYSYLFLFGSKAFMQNSLAVFNSINKPYSFGAGISLQSNYGVFSLIYALGSQYNQDIQWRSSRLHFGYLTRF